MKYNTIELKKKRETKLGVKLHPNQSSFVLKWHIKLKSHQLIQRLKGRMTTHKSRKTRGRGNYLKESRNSRHKCIIIMWNF